MKTVGIRALKQNASAVVTEAAAGEVVTITDRGRPVARLAPLIGDPVAILVEAGRARPAKRRLRDIGPALEPSPGRPALSLVLKQMRHDERY